MHGTGDEERGPPSWGSWVAAAVGGLAVLALGAAAGATAAAAVGLASAAGLAAAAVLVTDGDPFRVAAGTLLGVPSLAGVALAAAMGPTATALALAVAGFGAAAAPLDALGRGRFVEALGVLIYGLVPVGTAAIATALWPVAGALVEEALRLLGSSDAGAALLAFSAIWAVAAASLRSAVRALPAVELAPRADRNRVRAGVERAESALTAGIRYGLRGVAAGMLVWFVVAVGAAPERLVDLLSSTVGVPAVRWAVFGVAVAGLVVSVSVRTIRWTGATVGARARRGAAATAGAVLTLALVAGADRVLTAATGVAPAWTVDLLADVSAALGVLPTVLLSASVLLLFIVFASLLLPAAVGLGIAPERALAPAISAAGLLVAAALAAAGTRPAVVFGGVAAAMVVWDVGEYAVGVGEELGERGSPVPEAVHAGASAWTGLVAVVLAAGLLSLAGGSAPAGPLALAGLAAAVLGAIVLVAVLRG